MEKITKDISEIIAGEIKTINDKVRGLNFLELLKAGIIEKLLELVNKQKFPLDQLIEYQNEIKEDSRHINISINYFLKPMSINKKKLIMTHYLFRLMSCLILIFLEITKNLRV